MSEVASNFGPVELLLSAMVRGNTKRVDIGWWGDTMYFTTLIGRLCPYHAAIDTQYIPEIALARLGLHICRRQLRPYVYGVAEPLWLMIMCSRH